MAVVMTRLPAMDMGVLVAVVVGMDMVVFVGMNMDQLPMAVGMLVAVVMRMLMVVAMTMLSFHGALLFPWWIRNCFHDCFDSSTA